MQLFVSIFFLVLFKVHNGFRFYSSAILKFKPSTLLMNSPRYVYPIIRLYQRDEVDKEVIGIKQDDFTQQVNLFKSKTLALMSTKFGNPSIPLETFPSGGVYIPEVYSDAMLYAALQSNPQTIFYFYRSSCQSCHQLQIFFDQLSQAYGNVEGLSFYRGNVDYLPEFEHNFQIFVQFGSSSAEDSAPLPSEEKSEAVISIKTKNGQETCKSCNGEGAVICPECGGKKFIHKKTVAVICQKCGGKGKSRCDTCGGMCVGCLL